VQQLKTSKKYCFTCGFTLVELLVVVSVIALLLSLILPALGMVRRNAKVLVANSDLRQIGISLDMYVREHNGKHPPTRKDCSLGWEDHQLPVELVEGGYLPAPEPGSNMSSSYEDIFNTGHTYKYWAVGDLIQNGQFMNSRRAGLWIPDGFPDTSGRKRYYKNPDKSPVQWVVFSQGPDFDAWAMKLAYYPVPKKTWYESKKDSGIITRLQLSNRKQIGSFEEN
jgi:prepilin-type N-terminal cleavage/methylation domain-containing protein